MVEGINVFNVMQGMPAEVELQRVGLVVAGGFAPHYRAAVVVQALSHQIPSASFMFLYASRDMPPSYQDIDKVHIQSWTADADEGYVVLVGKDGHGGHSRCWSAESVQCRGVNSDPSLVMVSIFTSVPGSVTYVNAKISPSLYVEHFLRSNKGGLFCAEGDASLSCSCLLPSHEVIASSASLELQRYHWKYGNIPKYQWLLDQCKVEHASEGSFARELQKLGDSDDHDEMINAKFGIGCRYVG